MEAARPRHILRTKLGPVVQRRAPSAATYFGMCLDVARFLLEGQAHGDPLARPQLGDLQMARWEAQGDRYYGPDPCGNPDLIEAAGLRIRSFRRLQAFDGHFLDLVYDVIQRQGTILVGLVGHGGSHELLWHRDDTNDNWLFFDPSSGLWQFDSRVGVASSLAMDLVSQYDDRARLYRVTRLELD